MSEETERAYQRLIERAEVYFRELIFEASRRKEYSPFAELWVEDLTRIRTQEVCEQARDALQSARRKREEVMKQWLSEPPE